MSILNTKIQLRNDTSTNWESINPILANAEPGYDLQKKILKIGDGVTPWNTLKGIGSSTTSNPIPLYSYHYPGGTLVNKQSANSAANAPIANTDIIYALGTNFGISSYTNVVTSNKLQVTHTPLHINYPAYSSGKEVLFNRYWESGVFKEDFVLNHLPNNNVILDFGIDKKVSLSSLALQHSSSNALFTNVEVAYSQDYSNWTKLLDLISNFGEGDYVFTSIPNHTPARYIKFTQTGTNIRGDYVFALSEILLWGQIEFI